MAEKIILNSSGTPKYVGASAEVERVENGAILTVRDFKGVTQTMIYDGVSVTGVKYNDDFTVTIELSNGTEITTEDTLANLVTEAINTTASNVSAAQSSAEDAEAYAIGTRGGEAVEEDDPAYDNNAVYYMNVALDHANTSEAYAIGKRGGIDVDDEDPAYHNNSKYYAEQAGDYASDASDAKSDAETARDTASDYATAASNSASTASTKASEASSSASASASSASTASTKASEASASATSASGSATSAGNSATAASGSATTAGAKALVSEGFAVGEQGGVPVESGSDYYENNAKYYAEQAAESAATLTVDDELSDSSTNPVQNKVIKEELDIKANYDGYYEDLTAGLSENFVTDIKESDSTPYNFRTSGGALEIGDREYLRSIIGGSVAWNQLVKALNSTYFDTESGVTVSYSDGVATVSSTTASNGLKSKLSNRFQPKADHVYLTTFEANSPSAISSVNFGVGGLGYSSGDIGASDTNKWVNISKVSKPTGTLEYYVYYYVQNATYTDLKFRNGMIIDLTQMFGTTIADYVYSLEQTTAGAGVAWLKSNFPTLFDSYHAYDAGSLKSVKTSAHETTGKNLLPLTVNGIKTENAGLTWNGNKATFAGCTAEIKTDSNSLVTGVAFYGSFTGSNSNFVLSGTFSLPIGSYVLHTNTRVRFSKNGTRIFDSYGYLGKADVETFAFTVESITDVFRLGAYGGTTAREVDFIALPCIYEASTTDTEFEPYRKRSYALDADLELRGIYKLDANNHLYCDGDGYEPDGTVTRKYGIVDLGTLTWGYNNEAGHYYFTAQASQNPAISDIKAVATNNVVANMLCGKYVPQNYNTIYANTYDKSIGLSTAKWIGIQDSAYTDATAFKNSLSGTYLIYEKKEPTTEQADPYQEVQIVDNYGTEQFIDTRDVQIPVGHQTEYQADLRSKLEELPNPPSSDGDYIMRRSSGSNAYTPLVIPQEIPTKPSEDGTYILKCTVSSGTATLTWESEGN